MHAEARQFVAAHATDRKVTVLECGSRDVNGGVRDLFPHAKWFGVDLVEGTGVDVAADFGTYRHPKPVDVVVCCEVLEHTEGWPKLVESAAANLKPRGRFIVTAATDGRAPHSAFDGGHLQTDEWYQNINPADLETRLRRLFARCELDLLGSDIRAVAAK